MATPKKDWRELVGEELPENMFKFSSIKDVCLMDKGTKVEFVGIILNLGKPNPIKGRGGQPSLRMNMHLGDNSLNSINVGIWGAKIVNEIESKLLRTGWCFEKRNPVIVVIKNCRISDFDFRSLNVYEEEV